MDKFIKYATTFIYVVLLLLCLPTFSYAADDLSSPNTPQHSGPNERVASTSLAGVRYDIPIGYLGYPVKQEDRGALINALLPDMGEIREPSKVTGEQVAIIHVTDSSSTTSFEYRYGVIRKRLAPLQPTKDKYGLHAFLAARNSLTHKLIGQSAANQNLADEFYVNADSDVPNIFIDCLGDRGAPTPTCKEVFINDGLLFEVTFGKEHLAEWKAIQASVIGLMKRFAQTNGKVTHTNPN